MSYSTLDEGQLGKLHTVQFAGFGPRIVATIVDILVLIPFIVLGAYNATGWKSIPIMLAGAILSNAYKPYMEWQYGATLGKMAAKVKVVNEELAPISLEQAIVRYFPWLISMAISLVLNIQVYSSPGFQRINNFFELGPYMQTFPLQTASSVFGFIFLGLVLYFVFDSRKQGLHDKAARTYCIKVE